MGKDQKPEWEKARREARRRRRAYERIRDMPRTAGGLPVAITDLPEAAYPFTIEAFDDDGGLLWSGTVTGPGALTVPGFQGRVAECVVTYANGQIVRTRG